MSQRKSKQALCRYGFIATEDCEIISIPSAHQLWSLILFNNFSLHDSMRIQASSTFHFTLAARIDFQTPVSSESSIKLISLAGVNFQKSERKWEERLRMGRKKLRRFRDYPIECLGFYTLQQSPNAPKKSMCLKCKIKYSLKLIRGNI